VFVVANWGIVSKKNKVQSSKFKGQRPNVACEQTNRQVTFPVTISMEYTVAITGASGSIYAERVLRHMLASGVVERINLILSASAEIVARVELGEDLRDADNTRINEWLGLPGDSRKIHRHHLDNLAARPSSGSHPQEGMVIVPCSMGTLGAVASGAGTNLIHRAADVTLKEGRRLVLVPREAPYNIIHLENMLKLARAGAHLIPASPGFYQRPQSIEALVDHLVFRILDHLGVPHSQETRWKGIKEDKSSLVGAGNDQERDS